MKKFLILCVDDELDILDSIAWDLKEIKDIAEIEKCENAGVASEVLRDAFDQNILIPALLIVDHMMPEIRGVDFIASLNDVPQYKSLKTIMVTAHATYSDTIRAINSSRLHRYLSKPWKREELLFMVRTLLTDFVIENQIDPLPYMAYLDQERLLLSACNYLSE